MKKIITVLSLLLAVSASAQKMEHGALLGVGAGFSMQDKHNGSPEKNEIWGYNNDTKINGSIGYRLRFAPVKKSFYDVDFTLGLQSMKTYKYSAVYSNGVAGQGKNYKQFFMPIAVAGSWNYRLTDKFSAGLGVSPMLYVSPSVAFDVAVLAKVGYRVSKHCELGLSYQYGCTDVMKHFNIENTNGRKGHLSDLLLSVYIPFAAK